MFFGVVGNVDVNSLQLNFGNETRTMERNGEMKSRNFTLELSKKRHFRNWEYMD